MKYIAVFDIPDGYKHDSMACLRIRKGRGIKQTFGKVIKAPEPAKIGGQIDSNDGMSRDEAIGFNKALKIMEL